MVLRQPRPRRPAYLLSTLLFVLFVVVLGLSCGCCATATEAADTPPTPDQHQQQNEPDGQASRSNQQDGLEKLSGDDSGDDPPAASKFFGNLLGKLSGTGANDFEQEDDKNTHGSVSDASTMSEPTEFVDILKASSDHHNCEEQACSNDAFEIMALWPTALVQLAYSTLMPMNTKISNTMEAMAADLTKRNLTHIHADEAMLPTFCSENTSACRRNLELLSDRLKTSLLPDALQQAQIRRRRRSDSHRGEHSTAYKPQPNTRLVPELRNMHFYRHAAGHQELLLLRSAALGYESTSSCLLRGILSLPTDQSNVESNMWFLQDPRPGATQIPGPPWFDQGVTRGIEMPEHGGIFIFPAASQAYLGPNFGETDRIFLVFDFQISSSNRDWVSAWPCGCSPDVRPRLSHTDASCGNKKEEEAGTDDPAFEDNHMSSVSLDSLWATNIALARLDDDSASVLTGLRSHILALEHAIPTELKSNKGGWQSTSSLFEGAAADTPVGMLRHFIYDKIAWLVVRHPQSFVFPGRRTGHVKLEIIQAWAGINRGDDFNAPHIHPGGSFSGAFYVSVGEEEHTRIVLQDPRQGASCRDVSVSVSAGDLIVFPSSLWHYVPPGTGGSSTSPRIIVSFNARLEYVDNKTASSDLRVIVPARHT